MNVYKPVQSLQKSPIEVGGLCSVMHFKWEDVQTWPAIDPQTGFITTAIVMKPGAVMFQSQLADKGRVYEETDKSEAAGPFITTEVNGILGGTNTANILSLAAMRYHRWGLIVKDRAGMLRLIGNKDFAAKFTYKYTTADPSGSRLVNITWSWDSPLPPAIYQSQQFLITIGGVTVAAGSLKLIIRFKVGQPSSPMQPGDTVYTNAAMANKRLLIIANGLVLPQDDFSGDIDWTGSIERHVEKAIDSDQMTIPGGVIKDEIFELYEIS